MKTFEIVYGKDGNEDLIRDCVQIDELVYSEVYRGIEETCIAWWKKNPEIYVFIVDKDTGKAIGCINAMPITKDLHDRLLSKLIDDVAIDPEDILVYEPNKDFIMYFSSIAIHPDYQGTKAFKILYDGFMEFLKRKATENTYISKIIAEGVSAKGARICRLSGLQKVEETPEGTIIYELDLIENQFTPMSGIAEDLQHVYNSKLATSSLFNK